MIGTEIERAVYIDQLPDVGAAAAWVDLQHAHGACGWIGPPELTATDVVVGNEVQAAATAHKIRGTRAQRVGVEILNQFCTFSGSVGDP